MTQLSDTSTAKERFSKKLGDILNYGALNLAMGIGYRLGLFEVLDRLDDPAPAAQIAREAGYNERYTREWLGIMACGGIVELQAADGEEDRFHLPKAHGDLITQRAGDANMGVYTQEIPLLTEAAMAHVEEGFKTGNGIGYDRYLEFQDFMGKLADAKHRKVLVGTFLPSVDDGKLCRQLADGIEVCDLGCGQGLAVRLMAQAYPQSRFTGIDISAAAIARAEKLAEQDKLENTRFLCLDCATIVKLEEFEGTFDYVTAFDAIHDQTRPQEALSSILYMLKSGGAFSMIDITADSRLAGNLDHPMGAFLYTVSLMHCLPVGLVDGGTGLGMMWGRQQALQMLARAGFADIQVLDIPNDAFNTHYFCRKP